MELYTIKNSSEVRLMVDNPEGKLQKIFEYSPDTRIAEMYHNGNPVAWTAFGGAVHFEHGVRWWQKPWYRLKFWWYSRKVAQVS